MTTTIILYSIVSFIFIYVIHSLYNFFKDTLTTPQVKDLIHKPQSTYMELYNQIHNPYKESIPSQQQQYQDTQQQYIPETPEKETMKNNLKHYLKSIRSHQLKQTNGFETIHQSNAGGMSMSQAYSGSNDTTQGSSSQNLGFFSPNGDVPLSFQQQDTSNGLTEYDANNFSNY